MKSSTSFPSWSRKYSAGQRKTTVTSTRRFIHLPKTAMFIEHAWAFHFVIEVIAFTCPFTHTGKHRITIVSAAMLRMSSVITTVLPTPAPPNNPTLPPDNRCDQIDNFNSCFKISEFVDCSVNFWRRAVNWQALLGFHGWQTVDGFAQHVKHATKRFFADRHGNWFAQVLHGQTADKPSVVDSATVRTTPPPKCC